MGRKKSKTGGDGDGISGHAAKSTGKRGRKSQKAGKGEDGDDELGYESPTKKQKTISLRAMERIDYSEQLSPAYEITSPAQETDEEDAYQQTPQRRESTVTDHFGELCQHEQLLKSNTYNH